MELLKINKVAELFGVDKWTIRDWIKKGKLDSKKTVGGHNRITQESVVRLQKELDHDDSET